MLASTTSYSAGISPAANDLWVDCNSGGVDIEISGTFVATVTVERRARDVSGDFAPTVSYSYQYPGSFSIYTNQGNYQMRAYVKTADYTSGTCNIRLAQSGSGNVKLTSY